MKRRRRPRHHRRGGPVDATGTDDTGPFDRLRDLRAGQWEIKRGYRSPTRERPGSHAGTGALAKGDQRWRFSRMRMFSTIGEPSKP